MALEKFCFCCKLRNGVFICGILCIIRSFVLFVTIVANGYMFIETTSNIYDLHSYVNNAYSTYKSGWLPAPVYWLIITVSIIDFISSLLLVVGAVQRNHFLMLPWIILNGIGLLPLGIATAIILILLLPIYGPVYIWWCVCSAYQKVQENAPPVYDKLDSLVLSNSSMNMETES